MTTTIDTPATTPGSAGQTFLVGEEIYLRRIEKRDAIFAMSWRENVYPISPSVTEAWIGEAKDERRWYAVVRKSDDRVVGSLALQHVRGLTNMHVTIDPRYPDAGRWTGEVIRLVLPWRVDEIQDHCLILNLGGDETEAIAAASEIGSWVAARSPGLRLRNGLWVDDVRMVYLNRTWIDRIGDPRNVPLERTGTGDPRPVPAMGTIAGNPPAGVIRVGQRVYLKAIDTDDAHEMARLSRIEPGAYPGGFRAINSRANHVHRLLEDNDQRMRHDIGFAVRLREDDRFIGEVAVLDVDYVNRTGESASWMYDPAFRGNGFGSEAKHLLFDYCFNTLGLRALESFVDIGNTRSAAALRKQGYTEIGVIPWVGMAAGGFTGDIVFLLTAEAWRNLPRAPAISPSNDTGPGGTS